jgi:hypothetical protein
MVLEALLALAACPATDARDMLREAGQGFNGRVLEVHDDRLVIQAESRYDERSIAFNEVVTVHGRRLPATLQGRIGIVVRRRAGRWEAKRCDVLPGPRLAEAIHGEEPCPRPRVRIGAPVIDGRTVTLRLRFAGDTTGLRVSWAGVIMRARLGPGVAELPVTHTFLDGGRKVVRVRVTGAAGPGCGRTRALRANASRTVKVD